MFLALLQNLHYNIKKRKNAMQRRKTMEIKEILKNRRIELGLTLDDVAKQIGVSGATISRWESGDIENMKRDKISALAKVLKISPLVIMGMENPLDNLEDDTDTDWIAKMVKDKRLVSTAKLILSMDNSSKNEVYNYVEYIAKKKGLL